MNSGRETCVALIYVGSSVLYSYCLIATTLTACISLTYIICSNFSLLSRHGWCGTTLKLVTGEESAGLEDQEISHTGGWGVCGQTCDTRHRMVRGGHNEDLSDICAYTN